MTKEKAYKAMENGYKVKHRYFSDDEFLHMVKGVITSEEGYSFEEWWDSKTPWKENDWIVIQ